MSQPYPPNPSQPEQPYGAPQPQPGPTPGAQPQPPYPGPASTSEPSFFQALFDVRFNSFITLKFATFIYIIGIVLAALGWISLIIGSLATINDSPLPLIGAILLGWIPALFTVIWIRILIEFVISTIRTAQNTGLLVKKP